MTGTKIVASRAGPREQIVVRSAVILIVLVGSGVCAAQVLNPGFEATKSVLGRILPQNWDPSPGTNASFFWNFKSPWHTEGVQSVGIYYRLGQTVKAGSYQGFYQLVDLTGIGRIEFDVELIARAGYEVPPFAHFQASFLVDGVVLWSRNVGGEYRNQEVDVSKLTGSHRIEIRNTALESNTVGFGAAYYTEWDNVRLIEKPKAIPAIVNLDPGILNPNSNGTWITCYIELTEGRDVRTIDGASVTLNGISAYKGDQGWATAEANDGNVADFDGDGTLERMVKFERAKVVAVVHPPETTVTVLGQATDTTAGALAGVALKTSVSFEGAATLGVLTVGGSKR